MPLIETQPDALARIYARSLVELVQAKGGRALVEEVQAELEDILELARSDKRFGEFLSSRVVSAKDREASLQTIFRGRINDFTLRFLLVVNRKGRLGHLYPIAAAFDTIVQERFGRVEVDVYTAAPMEAAQREAIRSRLANVLKKDVVVHPYTDGKMIGGLKLQIGDQLIDGSIATRLRRMSGRFANEGNAQLRSRMDRILGE